MTEHATDWLGAYLDGELTGLRLRRAEAHLAGCAECRAELEGLRTLGALLQKSPIAEAVAPPERFVAQVGLRLPRRPEERASERVLEFGWRLVPAGLLATWAFVQTVFIVAGMLQIGSRLGLGGDLLAQLFPNSQGAFWLIDLLQLSEAGVNDGGRLLWELVRNGGPLGWAPTLYLAALAVIGLLYWSWLASWWVRRRRRQLVVLNNGM